MGEETWTTILGILADLDWTNQLDYKILLGIKKNIVYSNLTNITL